MPANIARDEYGFLSVYANEMPWHPEVGALVQGAMTAEQVIKRSRQNGGKGLGFTVESVPALVKVGRRVIEAPGYRGLVRTDTHEVFGFATDDYVPIQNIDALRLPQAIVATKQAGFISAGAIGNGAKLFATLDLSKLTDVKIPGDPSKHRPFLGITWSHDATEALRIAAWDRRIECANMRGMFLAATEHGSMTVRIRHTGDVNSQIADAQVVLGFAQQSLAAHQRLMAILNDTAIPAPANKWIAGFLENLIPIPEEMLRSQAREASREGIANLIRGSKTLRGVPQTLYRVVQAVDEYADNYRPTRTTDTSVAATRAMQRLLGEGPAADLKKRAIALIAAEFSDRIPELAKVASN